MAKKYTVEDGRSAGGARGFVVLNPKGRQVYFDTSRAEVENFCESLNAKLAPKKPQTQPKPYFTRTKTLARALYSVREFVQTLLADDGGVEIHTFKDGQGGIRVAEVSVTRGKSGYSWMRADAASGAGDILLGIEDFIITYEVKPYRPKGWESDIDEHADARYRLECAIKGRR